MKKEIDPFDDEEEDTSDPCVRGVHGDCAGCPNCDCHKEDDL